MEEIWRVVKRCPLYEVSNLGRVRRTTIKQHYLEPRLGYPTVQLWKGNAAYLTVTVHRLVAEAFIPNPDDLPTVNHKDGNKQNNSWPKNLAWGTHAQNEQDKKQNGTYQYGEKNPRAKLTVEDVAFIRKSKETARALAKKFNVSQNNIFLIKHNHTWQDW